MSIAANARCGEELTLDVHADNVLGAVSRHLYGSCIEDVNHEIYGGIYSQMIFGESFQEPAVLPPIKGFKGYGGIWTVESGELVVFDGEASNNGPKLLSEIKEFKDGRVSAEILLTNKRNESAGLIVRVSNPGVGADKFTGYEIGLHPGKQTLLLGRHANNFEVLKEVKCDVPDARWIRVEVRMTGSVIEVLVNNESKLIHDDGANALGPGTVGLRPWRSGARYKNLSVDTGGAITPLKFEQDRAAPVSGMWYPVRRGTAEGEFTLAGKPFVGTQSQQIRFNTGAGEWGVENRGLNRWGMNFVAGKNYEGYVWARAEKAAALIAALESRDGTRIYAETVLNVNAGDWQRLDFTLVPNAGDTTGRFVLKLKQPGSVTLGHAFLQPGEWGRFKGLPVRRDVAEGMIQQGITVLRYGGSMVNKAGYKWKNMIGPRDRRPPYAGMWYKYASNGWGILDFMDFCEAAGFEYIPAFNMGETPQDMSDFIDYATGPADSVFGRKRTDDGHPAPYTLKYIELGNEERVDEKYAARFEALAKTIWAKHPDIILTVGDFAYDKKIDDPNTVTGAASRIANLAGQQRILTLARENNREVWFDVHIGTEGPGRSGSLNALPSFIDALGKISSGAKHKVVVFELNAGNHSIRRALGNALALNAIERDGRLPICTSANGLQPDGQNDNGWDQGLLFLNPSQVWLQPPGYAAQMFARNYQPRRVQCDVTAGSPLDAVATRSDDGKTLVLKVVNASDKPVTAQIHLAGFVPSKPAAKLTELSGPLDATNTAGNPETVVPKQEDWNYELKNGTASHNFPAHSFTVIQFE